MKDVVVRGDIMSAAELIALEAELRECASHRYNTYAEVMRAAADAIEGLRARVTELEADVKTQMEVARRMDGLLYEARQVTRECDCSPFPSEKRGVFYFCQQEADKGDPAYVVYRRCTITEGEE